MNSSCTRRIRMRLALLPILLCLFGFSARMYAACGAIDGRGQGRAAKLPSLLTGEEEPLFVNPTVVGLWHAVYTNSATKEVFNDSFKSWHIDGTEIESAFLSPEGGNVCMGVWKQVNFRSAKLHHTGWLFNPASPTATATNYFTVDEFITVAPHGKTYTGTFTFKVFNLDGSPTPEVISGTIEATRITL
jgi:hypothetical protein